MPDATPLDELGHRLVAFILSPDLVAGQIDRTLAGMVIDGTSEVAPLTTERHQVRPGPATATSEAVGRLVATLPLDIHLELDFPVGTERYDFAVEVALRLTAEVTGPLSLHLACAPVVAGDVRIDREKLEQGLVDLEFFLSGALQAKVAEEVNRMLAAKDADRRIDLAGRIRQALGPSEPAPPAGAEAATRAVDG